MSDTVKFGEPYNKGGNYAVCLNCAKLQAELDREKKERSDLYIEYTMLRDRFGECFEYNQNCIDEIARLENKYAVLDKQYHNMFEIKEKDNEV